MLLAVAAGVRMVVGDGVDDADAAVTFLTIMDDTSVPSFFAVSGRSAAQDIQLEQSS